MKTTVTGFQLPIPVPEFGSKLLNWYRVNKRKLPWRNRSDPYQIWVSEVMLQQTQVKAVLPYYEKFLQAYPTLEDLARAEEKEVLGLWSGLGYYSRARNLRKAAQVVWENHKGEFPHTYSEVLKLPGIGRYTAGAILSIAYGQALPVVDGNVERVFARYLRIEDDRHGRGAKKLWNFLSHLLQDRSVAKNVADLNQALMELGARVCTPHNPDCLLCPLTESCRARKAGMQEHLPRPRRKRSVEELNYVAALVSRRGKYLLKQNVDEKFLRGFWEFPRIQGKPDGALVEAFENAHGLKLQIKSLLPSLTHRITFRRLVVYPVEAWLLNRRPARSFVWAVPGENGFPISAYIRKILQSISEPPP